MATPTVDSPTPCAPASTPWPALDGAAVAGRTVLVAGASGLVGREILVALLADDSVLAVHALVRQTVPVEHPRLIQHLVRLDHLPPLPRIDEVLIALGTTIKVAGSQAAFRAVDHDGVLAVARAAMKAGATRLGVVSAMGANARSSVFYNRVKGEMEQALQAMAWPKLVIARPSFLAGQRADLGQPVRSGETLALTLSRWLQPLIPANYRSIEAGKVARALVHHLSLPSPGISILPSGAMQAF